jgi:hypothetical protein
MDSQPLQLLPIAILLGFFAFQGVRIISYPIWVAIHELAHAIPALLLGKKEVTLELGDSPAPTTFRLGSLHIRLHRSHLHQGSTHYEGNARSVAEAILLILGAPFVSLLLTLLLGNWILEHHAGLPFPATLALSACWLASFHITFSVWWPFANPRSDLLAFIQNLRSRKRQISDPS